MKIPMLRVPETLTLGLSSLFLVVFSPFLFQIPPVYAQKQQVQLNNVLELASNALPNPPTFALPAPSLSLGGALTISVALCSTSAGGGVPRVFVSNNSEVTNPASEQNAQGVYELVIGGSGVGTFVLYASSGGMLAVVPGTETVVFDVGVSDGTDPLHELLTTLPLLGDTTSNQAIIFSPPFLPASPASPPTTYPNYTLPSAQFPFSSSLTPQAEVGGGGTSPNFTLIIGTTETFPAFDEASGTFSSSSGGKIPASACALRSANGVVVDTTNSTSGGAGGKGTVNETIWMRDEDEGWRAQWLVEGLQPQTNYTVWVVQDGTKLAGPINIVTKSGLSFSSFPCPLVHSLPYCPLVSYASPLQPPPIPLTAHDNTTIPANLTDPLLGYMTNFTTSLLTFACGRDWYSPLQSCEKCQSAYRTWACAVSLPRCGEMPPSSSSDAGAGAVGASGSTTQTIRPALVSQSSTSPQRNPNIAPLGTAYSVLLPCLETCNAVDRACPPFLQFTCPLPEFNANVSYGVGYIDGDGGKRSGSWSDGGGVGVGDGTMGGGGRNGEIGVWKQGGGVTGTSMDRWGNVWCAG
ncbi:hypothetical protein BD410DRAFT_583194 [Rickenella mellea]|uniref:FZ domain-containing protein n=1 Tax=Rickenella mellea TaxID=50990 RepID=A0A4Y7PNS1_9AGAM|nr:hypothetical protein BD410DRAFT_583194 [Rickenella mellea]